MASVVSNTGPILALAHIGQLELLRELFNNIILPPAVRAEIIDETSSAAVAGVQWISVQPVRDALAVQLLREQLDSGESEAVVLAKELSADLVLLDERAATRRARALGLTALGTLSVLLAAKQSGHVDAIKPLLEQLRKLDFYMSTDLYHEVLKTAGEAD